MKINRSIIRKLLKENEAGGAAVSNKGPGSARASGGFDSDIEWSFVQGIAEDFTDRLTNHMIDQNIINDGDGWTITFLIGPGIHNALPIVGKHRKAKDGGVPHIHFLGGGKSFGSGPGTGGDRVGGFTRRNVRMNTVKKVVRKFIEKEYAAKGLKHERIRPGKDFVVTISSDGKAKGGAISGRASEQMNPNGLTVSPAIDGGEAEVQDTGTRTTGTRDGDGKEKPRKKRRGGGNKCIRMLQEFLKSKSGVEKPNGKKFGSGPRDVDGAMGSDTRYAWYFFIAKYSSEADVIKKKAEEYMKELRDNPSKYGRKGIYYKLIESDAWILTSAGYSKSPTLKTLCEYVEKQKEGGSDEPEGPQKANCPFTDADSFYKHVQGLPNRPDTDNRIKGFNIGGSLVGGDGIPLNYFTVDSEAMNSVSISRRFTKDSIVKSKFSGNDIHTDTSAMTGTNIYYDYNNAKIIIDGIGRNNGAIEGCVLADDGSGEIKVFHVTNPKIKKWCNVKWAGYVEDSRYSDAAQKRGTPSKEKVEESRKNTLNKNKKLIREFKKYLDLA